MRVPFLYQLSALLALLLLSFAGPWVVFSNVVEDSWASGGFVGHQPLLRWWPTPTAVLRWTAWPWA